MKPDNFDMAVIKFDDRGLVPAIVQNVKDGAVLMMAWMNEESVRRTLEQRTTWFWSRSRQELWNKGGTSGNFLHVQKIMTDCDTDTLLYFCLPDGPTCHTGADSCFFREISLQ